MARTVTPAVRSSSGIDTSAVASAATSMVRCVPIAGMSNSADPNVPTIAPTVVSDERRPLVRPARSTAVIDRRSANGDAMPRSDTGTENRSSVEKNEPTTSPTLTAANPRSARSRKGWAMNGSAAVQSAAATSTAPSTRGVGWRSARRPPSQYPTERYTRMSPITLAHTTVLLPKYGASRRVAQISMASEDAPAANTTTGSTRYASGRRVVDGRACARSSSGRIGADPTRARWHATGVPGRHSPA